MGVWICCACLISLMCSRHPAFALDSSSAQLCAAQIAMDLTTPEVPPATNARAAALEKSHVTTSGWNHRTGSTVPRTKTSPAATGGGGGARTAKQPKPQHCVVNLSIKTYKTDSSEFPWQRQNIIDGKNDVPLGLGITMAFYCDRKCANASVLSKHSVRTQWTKICMGCVPMKRDGVTKWTQSEC